MWTTRLESTNLGYTEADNDNELSEQERDESETQTRSRDSSSEMKPISKAEVDTRQRARERESACVSVLHNKSEGDRGRLANRINGLIDRQQSRYSLRH